MLDEFMRGMGCIDIRLCLPIKETHYPDLLNDCLAKESESDFDMPPTYIIEAGKPKNASAER
jgi:hypothetical protein